MIPRTKRPLGLLAVLASLALSAGCGDDPGVVRGTGSIDVPRPTKFSSPEEAAAYQNAGAPAPAPAAP